MKKIDDYRRDILNHIYVTGGYTNIYNLMMYLDVNKSTSWHHLELLSTGNIKERYLKKINADVRNSREKTIYQVTTKTCSLFGNPNSYYRKKHKKEYIARSLLKNRYFSIYKEQKKNAIFLHNDKLQYLNDIGIEKDILPTKYIGKDKIFTVEDTLLIESDGIRIIYFDKESVTVKRQVNSLYANYSRLIRNSKIAIYIKVITTNKFRELEYIKEMRKYNRQLYNDNNIEEDLIALYTSFVKKYSEKKGEDTSIILQNYKDGTIKNILTDRLKNTNNILKSEDIEVIREVGINGIQYIINAVKNMMDNNESESIISEYFMNLLRLNFHGYLIFHNRKCVANIEVLSAKLF